jgi:thioredoxin 1
MWERSSPKQLRNQGNNIMAPVKVTDTSFQTDVLNAKGPVVVDFWAEWCGPCKMIAPALDELSTELGGKVTIVKINIDENPHTPQKYGVRGIPTMMIFSQGQVAATKVGALPKSKIKEWIESSVGDLRSATA